MPWQDMEICSRCVAMSDMVDARVLFTPRIWADQTGTRQHSVFVGFVFLVCLADDLEQKL